MEKLFPYINQSHVELAAGKESGWPVQVGEKLQFRRVLWGFNPREVRAEINQLIRSHQEVSDRYQEEKDMLAAEIARLREQAEALEEKLNAYRDGELLLAEVLLRAQAKAWDIEQAAHREAERIIGEAEKELASKRIRLELVEQQQKAFLQEFKSLYERLDYSVAFSSEVAAGYRGQVGIQSPGKDNFHPFVPGRLDLN